MADSLYDDSFATTDIRHDEVKANALVWSLFKRNESGKKLLDYWVKAFLQAPVCEPGMIDGAGHYREGQNSFVRMIFQKIQEHEDYENHRESK